MGNDRLRLRHPPGPASLSGGEYPLLRLENLVAQLLAEVPNVFDRLTVRPHRIIHGGEDEDGRLGRKQDGGQEVPRLSRRGARDEVRRCRRDDDRLRLARELDVIERAAGVEEPGMDGTPRERFEGDATDEFGGAGGEHDVHLGAGLA